MSFVLASAFSFLSSMWCPGVDAQTYALVASWWVQLLDSGVFSNSREFHIILFGKSSVKVFTSTSPSLSSVPPSQKNKKEKTTEKGKNRRLLQVFSCPFSRFLSFLFIFGPASSRTTNRPHHCWTNRGRQKPSLQLKLEFSLECVGGASTPTESCFVSFGV